MTPRRHEALLTVLIVAAFVVAIVAVQIVSTQADRRAADKAVASCERGNEIRSYLSFDNGARIARLEEQLADPRQITDADARAFRDELTRRYQQRDGLAPFDCETLR